MRHHSANAGSTRFLSREYNDAIGALRTAVVDGPTVITLGGGSPQQLEAGAQQVARSLGRSLYRVNLSQIVSKYIGETEKNLERLFGPVQATSFVLFFEDGDALFGRGTSETAGQDPGTQPVNRILERLNGYRGFVIAALRHPLSPVQRHRRMRHLHVTFPSA